MKEDACGGYRLTTGKRYDSAEADEKGDDDFLFFLPDGSW